MFLEGVLKSFTKFTGKHFPLGEITSRGQPEDIPKKTPEFVRTSPYGPICNAKGRICNRTSLGRNQDVSLTIIHKMSFQGFFSIFPDSNCISDIVLPKLVENLIRPILVLLWSGTFPPK